MDVSDAPASQGAMIAFLPTTTEWCEIELPHMTLVYAGTIDKLPPTAFNELAKDAAAISMLTRPFALTVRDVDVFGDEEKVNVLRFRPTPELLALRKYVERWNASEHSFNPHATIGPATSYAERRPGVVGFDRVMVGWGDDQMVFNLKDKY
jgi:2'-5' RNA ligase